MGMALFQQNFTYNKCQAGFGSSPQFAALCPKATFGFLLNYRYKLLTILSAATISPPTIHFTQSSNTS